MIEELRTKADLLRFVRQQLNVPENLRGILVGSFLKVAAPADVQVNWGRSSVTFTAAATSATATIAHGLRATPALVLCGGRDPDNGLFLFMEAAAPDATNIYIKARQTMNAAVTATQNFYWLAIG